MAITIEDVAKEAKTSISTVSKALNDSYTISDGTKARVREAAEKLGYKPNFNAQALSKRSTKKVVFLTNLSPNMAFETPHMFEVISGAESELRRKGYSLQICSCTLEEAPSVAKSFYESRSVDGLIIYASIMSKELSLALIRNSIPHITIGKTEFSSRLCWIDTSNVAAGEIAGHHLYDFGFENIAFIGGFDKDKISMDRLLGVKSALAESEQELKYIKQGEPTVENGEALTKELLQGIEANGIDAIICANNYLAVGCLRAVKALGFHVPDDIGIITFDDFPFTRITSPKLSAVNIDVFGIGKYAGELLIDKIRKPSLQIQSYITSPSLIVRESTDK